MVTTTQDLVTEDTVASIVQAQTQAMYGFRQAFRDHNGSNAGSSMSFPKIVDDFQGDMVEIPESSEYPRAEKEYGDVEAAYTKYGFESPITDEAIDDGTIDLELDTMQGMARAEARRLDRIAYNVLAANLNGDITGGNNDGSMTFEEVVDTRAKMRKAEYMPDMMLVEPLGAAGILKDEAFQLRDTPVGDRVVLDGFVGSVAGLDIFEVNTGGLADYSAILVDTDMYGYESTKYTNDISSYREDTNDQTVYKIRDRLDWAVTEQNAAVLLQG